MLISVVTTSYNSSNHINEFIERISNIFANKSFAYEIIIVDDGSTDNTLDIIKNSQLNFANIILIELSRNFGHHPAIRCGLEHANGDLIYLIDSDLEEEPELFDEFYKELKVKDLDLVFGQQEFRRGNLLEKVSGNIFYFVIEHFGGFKIPKNIVTARLMNRNYLNAYLSFGEREFLLGGITKLTGFKQKGLTIIKKRIYKTNYTLLKKFQVLVRSITNYSSRPLYLLFCAGLIISIISFFMILYFFLLSIFKDIQVSGWLTIVSLSWLGIGITILSNGILAVYLKTIFTEVKGRPTTLIRNIYRSKKQQTN